MFVVFSWFKVVIVIIAFFMVSFCRYVCVCVCVYGIMIVVTWMMPLIWPVLKLGSKKVHWCLLGEPKWSGGGRQQHICNHRNSPAGKLNIDGQGKKFDDNNNNKNGQKKEEKVDR